MSAERSVAVGIAGLRRAGLSARDAARILSAVDTSDPRYYLLIMPARPLAVGDQVALKDGSGRTVAWVEVADFQEAPGERVVVVGYRRVSSPLNQTDSPGGSNV